MGILMKGFKRLEVGAVVWYENRVYRIGLVNDSRARLDPVTGHIVTVSSPASGRTFQKYGPPISVSPFSYHSEVDLSTLDESAIARLIRMQADADKEDAERAANPVQRPVQRFAPIEGEEDDMAVASAAPAPSKADQNAARLAQVAANKAARAADRTAKTAENVVKGKTKAVSKENPCKCGCGGVSAGFFVPGHDARFKGWMTKIERGTAKKADLLTPEVIAQYKWIKVAGGGERPTTYYTGATTKPDGTPFTGYAAPLPEKPAGAVTK